MPLLYHKTVYYVLALPVYYVTTLYSLLPPKYVGEAISLPIILSKYSRRLCGRILPYNDYWQIQTKRREQAPALRCTDVFLCIYCEFRICNTNAVGLCPFPYSNSPIRTSPINFSVLFFIFLSRRVFKESRRSLQFLR